MTEREVLKLFCEPLPKGEVASLLNRVILDNSCVRAAYELGVSIEQIVCILQYQYDQTFKRMMELDSITPRKYKLPDGKVVVWHAPDNLIPEISLEDD